LFCGLQKEKRPPPPPPPPPPNKERKRKKHCPPPPNIKLHCDMRGTDDARRMASVMRRSLFLDEAGVLHKREQANNSLGLLCCRLQKNEEISRCQSRCESDLDNKMGMYYLCRKSRRHLNLALAMVEEDHGASVDWIVVCSAKPSCIVFAQTGGQGAVQRFPSSTANFGTRKRT